MRAINLPAIAADYPATETTFTDSGGAILLAKSDPSRWSIGFSTGAFNPMIVSTKASPGTNAGLLIGSNSGLVKVTFADFPGLVGQEWWLIGSGTMNQITVFESFMKPRPRND